MRINDNGVDREMTADELATYETNAALIEADQQAAAQAAADALEARKAPLHRIGLTDDEINIVLGL